ncbi:MAG: hypothetical protein ACRD5K_16375 [Candidatus Acidiferrales bacterium]
MNRRKMLSLLGISPALLAGAKVDARTLGDGAGHGSDAARALNGGASGAAEGCNVSQLKLTGVNPKGTPPAIQLFPMAPRLSTLDGKTIYLVDTGFQGGDILLKEMQIWFQKNMPTVKTVYKRKAGVYFEDDPPLWQEIKAHGNAAIMAIGH